MAGIAVERLSKSYGTVKVLREVGFEARDGEFVALVGPSGCGKSTLLRCLAGLDGFEGGRISIAGRIVNDLEPKERDVAMVFQNYALYPHMTVRQNMGFSLKLRGGNSADIAARVQEAAAILGLMDYLDRYPRQLSGGQRQRVAMGRAIVRDPQVFLFDEPLSNLDAKLRVQMRAEIKELHQRLATTTVYVTHDQIEAMTMADKIVVMRSGIVEQVGPPLELYDKPANMFVAGFIGSPSMNFLKGKIGASAAPSFVTETGITMSLLDAPAASAGARAVLGIRPEHFMLDQARGVPAEIIVIEPTGAETQVIARLAGQNVTAVFRERIDARPGSTIPLALAPYTAHLFNAETSRAMN